MTGAVALPAELSLPAPATPWLRRIVAANLVAQTGIVLTGGLVRLTGSGLGCPTWPQCVPGSYTPVLRQAQGWHKNVEFGNRLLTGVLITVAVATSVGVWTHLRGTGSRSRVVLWLGLAPTLGVLAQIVLGGLTVLSGLSPASVAAHFLLSMVLVAAAKALQVLLRAPEAGYAAPPELRRVLGVLVAVTVVVLALGTVVTGAGPHSGDATRPARFGLDPRTVSWVHADAVLLLVGLSVAVAVGLRLTGAPARARGAAIHLLGVIAVQGAVGYLQYATGLPVPLVAVHLVGAALVAAAVTGVAVETLRARPAPG